MCQNGGKQEMLVTVPAADTAVSMADLEDFGTVGAPLLSLEDTTTVNNVRYVLSGPEEVTGRELVNLVQQHAGVKVGKAGSEDTSFLNGLTKNGLYTEKAMSSFLAGCEPLSQGKCSLASTPTSRKLRNL